MGRPRKNPLPETGTVQITFRMPVEDARLLDDEVERIARENFGVKVERTEIVRRILTDELRKRGGKKRK